MKTKFKFILLISLLIILIFEVQFTNANEINYQTITLQMGWNIISTPKVLASHQFSADEISDNFDIYLLDPTSPSGWQTMQGAGQSEFQPLFAYFINNKTGQSQNLTLTYNFDLTPAQRLFQRTLQPGWNAIGIASPSYAVLQGSTIADINNPSNILSSINGSLGQVVDFTNGNVNLDSPAISGTWLSKTISSANSLNDFRELKGYGVFITNLTDDYIGSQNLSLSTQYTLNYTAGVNGSITGTASQIVVEGEDGTAVTAVANAGYHFVDWSDRSTDNPRTDTNVLTNINVTANFEATPVGTLVLSKYTAYTDQNIVAPQTAYKLAHFTLTAGTTEAVNVNTITLTLDDVSGFSNNLYVKFGNNETSTKSTTAATNSWSVNYSVAAGTTVDIMVYANITSSAIGDAVASLYINGTTASSATAICADGNASCTVGSESALAGQTINFKSGSMTLAVDGSTPLDQAIAGGQPVVAAKFKFTAANDNYTIKELKFQIAGTDATSAVVSSLTVKDGSSTIATVPYDGVNDYYNITGLTIPVTANSTKVLTVELNLATPYTNGSGSTAPTLVTTGKNAKITLYYAKVSNSQGTESEPTASKVANYTYVYKSIPTLTTGTVSGQGTLLVSGSTVELYKFTVAADAKGEVALKQIKFAVDITDGGTDSSPTLDTFKFFRGSTDLSNSVHILEGSATTLEDTTSNLDENDATTVYVVFDTEETIPAGTTYTYTLKARAQGFMGTSTDADSVSTTISSDTTPAGVAAGANATHYFLDADSTTDIQALYSSAAGDDYAATSGVIPNIIWSDKSAQLHDYTYSASSSDWFNGYLIENLPLNSIGINYNN